MTSGISGTEPPAVRPGGRVERSAQDFDDFVAARSTALLRTAYLLTRDHAHAEDLLQTALTKVWFAWARIDASPEAYARRVLVTTYASWWRRKWNGESPTDDLPEAPAASAASGDLDLWTAMGRLPRRMRAVVVLRYFEDLTERETADVLGCSIGTVKSQTHRALAHLRVDPALAFDQTSDETTEGGSR